MVSEKPGLATLRRNRRGNKFLQRNERWESWVGEAGLKRCETWERGKGVSSFEVPESFNGTFVLLLPFPTGLKTFISSQRFIYILLAFAKNFNKTLRVCENESASRTNKALHCTFPR